MRRPGPDAFENEAIVILEHYLEEDTDEQEPELNEEEENALLKKRAKQWEEYFLEHASPLLREWYIYYNSRCGDEGELYDYDGTFLIGESGYPIQEWDISDDHRIIDEAGEQIYSAKTFPLLGV